MFEVFVLLFAVYLIIRGLDRRAGIYFAIAFALFIISGTLAVHHGVEHVVVNGTIQTLTTTTFNYPILYSSWVFAALSVVLLILSLFDKI